MNVKSYYYYYYLEQQDCGIKLKSHSCFLQQWKSKQRNTISVAHSGQVFYWHIDNKRLNIKKSSNFYLKK